MKADKFTPTGNLGSHFCFFVDAKKKLSSVEIHSYESLPLEGISVSDKAATYKKKDYRKIYCFTC